MSYILEALKKSQTDRELGQVPRIEGFGIDVPIAVERNHPWAYLALLTVLITLGSAGFVLLGGFEGESPDASDGPLTLAVSTPGRGQISENLPVSDGTSPPPPGIGNGMSLATPASPASADSLYVDSAIRLQPPADVATPLAPPSAPRQAGGPLTAEPMPTPATGPAEASPSVGPGTEALDEPAAVPPTATAKAADTRQFVDESAGVGAPAVSLPKRGKAEPQVIVVPAPREDGEPLPRGAEELRRAVVGDGGRVAVSRDTPSLAVDATEPSPSAAAAAPRVTDPSSEQTTVPADVLAEIEAFKELVRQRDPDLLKRAAAAPPRLPDPPGLEAALRPEPRAALPARPSLELRGRLPPFSMNVHVYNQDANRRFIYINGRKLGEGQESQEGIRVEQVVAEGAVLSYAGERFFQQR